ncbi:MAG: hypothetical protein ACRD9R_11195 [Pyrinomonadaceae bacterium]
MRRLPPQQQYRNSDVRRERDRGAFARQLWLLSGGLLVAGGFVVVLCLHFAAVRHGYRNEELRRERARLLEEQRQLQLELSEATSPATLERAARRLGLQPARPHQMETNLAVGEQSAARTDIDATAVSQSSSRHRAVEELSASSRRRAPLPPPPRL